MKNKNILIFSIVLLIIVLLVTLYSVYRKKAEKSDSYGYLHNLGEKVTIETDINYLDEYKDNIIDNEVKEVDYEMFFDDTTIYGKVFINESHELYITNGFTKENYKINTVKFKTLYKSLASYAKSLIVYAISQDGDLYKIVLNENNIKHVKDYKIETVSKVLKFTNLQIYSYACTEPSLVVLCVDNKMYDVKSGLLYSTTYKKFFDKYLIFDDKSLTNSKGKKIINFLNEQVKIRGFIETNNDEFEKSDKVLFFTTTDELLYLYDENNTYIYVRAVKSVENVDAFKAKMDFYKGKSWEFEGHYTYYVNSEWN